MGRKKIGEFLIFIIVKFFAPILILLRQFGGWFKRVEKSPPPLSSPVKWGGWNEKRLKLTPQPLSSPVKWGGWVMVEFLFCALLIFSPPTLSSPVRWGGRNRERFKQGLCLNRPM
jgi:hypothetical protein